MKRPSRPFADFSVAEEVLAAWRPIHRTVQFALAIVAASDAQMRAASTWPGERPDELRVTPGLVFAAEGGVSIHVLHRRRPSEAFAEARARAAGRALSGRSSSQYRRWERLLDDGFGDADCLWALLGVPC